MLVLLQGQVSRNQAELRNIDELLSQNRDVTMVDSGETFQKEKAREGLTQWPLAI